MTRSPRLLGLLWALLLAGCAAAPLKVEPAKVEPAKAEAVRIEAHEPAPLKVVVFPGGFNWPLWVAQDRGLFAREGVDVSITATPNSVAQMKGLIDGSFDIAMTAMDNVVAYREGQGEAGVDGKDLVAVSGSDAGFLRIVAAPGIRTYQQLRGQTLSVDALTTGFAFVLREMLARAGLELDRDYRTERAGGVLQRYEALLQRRQAATLLVAPFDLMAQAQGFEVLGRADEVLGPYQGVVVAVRQGWAREHRHAVSSYIRAHADAIDWLADPAHQQEARAIFLAHMPPGTPAGAAQMAYRALVTGDDRFQAHARIDLQGVDTVVKLRARYGPPGARLRPAADYCDLSYYDAAFRDAARR